MLEDYAFFGQVFRWQPSEIDNLKWSYRKKLKQAYKDYLASNKQ
jgi:hypothetical protein